MPSNDPSNNKKKVCFFALNAYPVFSGNYQNIPGEIGGAELQQSIIGRELAKKGYNISFIVFDNNNQDPEVIDNVIFYKTIKKDYSFSGILSYLNALRSIWRALKTADAEWYYLRGADPLAGVVSIFCIFHKRKFVFALANDMDINGEFFKKFSTLSKILYKFGLVTASKILVQTEYQKSLLKSVLNRDCILIKNVYPYPSKPINDGKRSVVLWVGTIRPWKQPEVFLQLARSLPHITFRMVGGPAKERTAGSIDQFYQKIKKDALSIPNLEFSGFIPYQEIDRKFSDAAIFTNTSTFEGYPNTFMQAWANTAPVISLNVDPDGIISTFKLGYHSKSFDQLVIDVDTLMRNENYRLEFGTNGRIFVEKEHSVNRIIPLYFNVFDN